MKERFELFVTTINQINRSLQKIKNQEMSGLHLKGTHVMSLYYLSMHEEGITLTELSHLCGEDKAAVSRTIAELTREGYTVLDAEQKYRARIKLTEEGKEISRRVSKMIEDAVLAGGEKLTEKERLVFYKALLQISRNLQKYLTKEV